MERRKLCTASKRGDGDTVEKLLKTHKMPREDWRNALMLASANGHADVVEILLKHGTSG